MGLFIIFLGPQYSLNIFFCSLFTIHYKKSHYSLIIIPHPDPHDTNSIVQIFILKYSMLTKHARIQKVFSEGVQLLHFV